LRRRQVLEQVQFVFEPFLHGFERRLETLYFQLDFILHPFQPRFQRFETGLVLAIFWAIVYEKTRDIGILRNGRVTHGYWLRSTEPDAQLEEVIRALQLGADFAPYTRCLECNGACVPISRGEAAREVPLQVFLVYRDFRRCTGCGRVYWAGSHLRRLDRVIAQARAAAASRPQ